MNDAEKLEWEQSPESGAKPRMGGKMGEVFDLICEWEKARRRVRSLREELAAAMEARDKVGDRLGDRLSPITPDEHGVRAIRFDDAVLEIRRPMPEAGYGWVPSWKDAKKPMRFWGKK